MIHTSTCSHCAKIFSYNDKDSKGIYCTRKCHYQSKKHMAICKNCGKEFQKNQKEKRQTCSIECYRLRRALKSKDVAVKTQAHVTNSENAGQTSIARESPGNSTPSSPIIPPDEQVGNSFDTIGYNTQENGFRIPFADRIKNTLKKAFIDTRLFIDRLLDKDK
jgi:hypothetical protein